MTERDTLHLVDGSGYIFRAFYGVRPLSTSTGVPTNAVTGVARMLGRLLKEEQPSHLGVAFDRPEKTFRHQLYPAYKANRDEPPEDLVPQFALVRRLVEAMDIPVLEIPGFEADDVIATLTRLAVERGMQVVIVTGDKDLMQLVGDRVTIYDPMKEQRIGVAEVHARFGVPPERVADVLALAGDTSDNIQGVPKVGPKSAATLVAAFGDVEAVIRGAAQAAKPKAYERAVVEHQEAARLAKRLTVLAADAPLGLDLDALRYAAPRAERLGPLLRELEAFSLLRDFGWSSAAPAEATPGDTPAPAAPVEGGIDRTRYRTILSLSELEAEVQAAFTAGEVSVDLETTSLDPTRAEIVGVALCVPGRAAVYVPLAHRYLGAPKQIPRPEALACLRRLCEAPAVAKLGQNLKYDQIVFAGAGITLAGVRHDAMLAAWVLDPARPSYSLDTLAREELGHETIRYTDVTGKGAKQIGFDEVPIAEATAYAAEDADVALRLCRHLHAKITAAQLTVYDELEIPLLPVLAEMERTGIRLDLTALRRLAAELEQRLAQVERRAHAMIGEPLNLASPRQLAALFFERLKYQPVKKTKTGYSTDQEVLETLAREHELPGVILEHRLLAKLKSTYTDALVRMVHPLTGRVHTSFNQTGTATGRLSSSDPNLQNIPVRTEDGRRIRAAFVPEPGWVLVSADYSQIELRLMAHLSADPSFVEAFHQGEDIHLRTAREVLTGGAQPTPDQRRQAKAINFGVLYGQSDFGLSRQLGIPRLEAEAFISAYFARYPRVRAFCDQTVAEARERGYVTTLAGRRRFLPDLTSKNRNLRLAAERVAVNTPIQGSAADLIKLAMIRLAAALRKRRLRARLLLQVHDELVLETPAEELAALTEVVRQEMTGVAQLSVPLIVDIGHGPTWADAH